MTTTWILALALLTFFTLLVVLISMNRYKIKNPKKRWKLFGLNIGLWQGSVMIAGACTFLSLYLLQWLDILGV
jgi:hypothetical protein